MQSPRLNSRTTASARSAAAPPPTKPPKAKDYVRVAKAYAQRAANEKNKAVFGKKIRLAARRFLADLERAKLPDSPFYFDTWHAKDVCDFIEKLPHVEGSQWETRTIVLEPAQIFFLAQLFGFRRRDGSRRFTTALFCVARKNAKSTLAAGILLYCQTCEGEIGPQILSAATTGSQARVVFDCAKKMVQATPGLWTQFGLNAFANSIASFKNGGAFKPINAKASTQDGLNPSAICFDELHAHKTRDLYDVLRSAAGARRNPLFLYTTTEGYLNPGPWSEVKAFAFNVLDGVVKADHFLVIFYAIDDDDDEFDERCWIKANPLLGVSVELEKLRDYATEAAATPGGIAEFRTKRCNRASSTSSGHIDLLKWDQCKFDFTDDEIRGLPCFGGLDLASTEDLNSWARVWVKFADNENRIAELFVRMRFWVPEETIKKREARGVSPYGPWAGKYINVTEGNVVDYEKIEEAIIEDNKTCPVQVVGYDSWNATAAAQTLEKGGVKCERVIQGFRSFHPAVKEVDVLYKSGNLHHDDNQVLRWNASNLVVDKDQNESMKPNKKRSKDKIDGMTALYMAVYAALCAERPKPIQFFTVGQSAATDTEPQK